MISVIRDIVSMMVFLFFAIGGGGMGAELVYSSVKTLTQERISAGLRPMTPFTDALIGSKSEKIMKAEYK